MDIPYLTLLPYLPAKLPVLILVSLSGADLLYDGYRGVVSSFSRQPSLGTFRLLGRSLLFPRIRRFFARLQLWCQVDARELAVETRSCNGQR